MGPFQIILLVASTLLKFSGGDAAVCEAGWEAFKDQLCIRIFPNELSYDEATQFCSSQDSSLVIVTEPDMQTFLANHIQTLQATNLWLGSKYDPTTGQFRWEDGTSLTYANWEEGYPINTTNSETCIEIVRPSQDSSVSRRMDGNWRNENCQNQKRVICQRPTLWTLQDVINEMQKTQNELQMVNNRLTETTAELRQQLEAMQGQAGSSNYVPIGFIYIEYFNQSSPGEIWPNFTWVDITSTYQGLFFRAQGGNSAGWGETQTGCAPRITSMQYTRREFSCEGAFPTPVNFPASGWSLYGHAGYYMKDGGSNYRSEGLSFKTNTCEVRPSNQAIRVWKRTA